MTNRRANITLRARTWVPFAGECALVGTLLIASPTHAQSSSDWVPPAPTEDMVVTASGGRPNPAPPPEFHPPPIGAPTGCDKFLPSGLTIPQSSNGTLFSYRQSSDGQVHDATLLRSSGNNDLDKAALACANGSHLHLEIVGGIPAAISWVGGIDWARPGHPFFEPTPDGAINLCRFYYPPDAIRRNQQGTVVVGFRIAADGSVNDGIIVQSSGSRALDRASQKCVESYRYFPAKRNEQPVEIDRASRVIWRIQL